MKGNGQDKETEGKQGIRNYSLDLLRILAMMGVVILHSGSHGGLSSIFALTSPAGLFIRLITICCSVSVNVFVLISAYFLSSQLFRLSRIIKLLIEVLFYVVLVVMINVLHGEHLSVKDYLYLFLPVSYGTYWFLTAYIGMVLASPLLNQFFKNISKGMHLCILVVMILLTCVARDVFVNSDPWLMNRGYSLLWFIELYGIAYYLRFHLDGRAVKHPFCLYLISCLIMMGIWAAMTLLGGKIGLVREFDLDTYYIRYNSSITLLASVLLFLAFLRSNISNQAACKAISFLSPLTFGVYLLHDNPYMRNIVWSGINEYVLPYSDAMILVRWAGYVLALFMACLLIDYIRTILFNPLYKSGCVKKALDKIDEVPRRVFERINAKVAQ